VVENTIKNPLHPEYPQFLFLYAIVPLEVEVNNCANLVRKYKCLITEVAEIQEIE
jgi:hypothetical protein